MTLHHPNTPCITHVHPWRTPSRAARRTKPAMQGYAKHGQADTQTMVSRLTQTNGRRPVATSTETAPRSRSTGRSSPERRVRNTKRAHAESRRRALDRARPSKQAVNSLNQKRR